MVIYKKELSQKLKNVVFLSESEESPLNLQFRGVSPSTGGSTKRVTFETASFFLTNKS
jgi:hypothetical protein